MDRRSFCGLVHNRWIVWVHLDEFVEVVDRYGMLGEPFVGVEKNYSDHGFHSEQEFEQIDPLYLTCMGLNNSHSADDRCDVNTAKIFQTDVVDTVVEFASVQAHCAVNFVAADMRLLLFSPPPLLFSFVQPTLQLTSLFLRFSFLYLTEFP